MDKRLTTFAQRTAHVPIKTYYPKGKAWSPKPKMSARDVWHTIVGVFGLIFGLFVLACVCIDIWAMATAQDPPAQKAPVARAEPAPAPAPERSWEASYFGHTISCGITGGGANYYIVMPNSDELSAGVMPIMEAAPTQEAWAICYAAMPEDMKTP